MFLTSLVLAFTSAGDVLAGPWRAWLDSPGGELPFALQIEQRPGELHATIANGEERIDVPVVRQPDGALRFEFPHYDSRITARAGADGSALDGEWTQVRAGGALRRMAFHARAGVAPRFAPETGGPPDAASIAGRWAVRFEKDERPAVALLRTDGARVLGTFLTATGDHRYLEGTFQGGRLRLSCFDGAHAFLYDARLGPDGVLSGTFFSGEAWRESWAARRDERAALPNEFDLWRWSERPGLWTTGVDAQGRERVLAEFAFERRALVVQIAGSWCPNCHDELHWLAPLVQRLAPRGLGAVTLGFELTGEPARDLEQLRRMHARHGAQHPFLLVGTADKARAATALGQADRLVAFPTLIVLTSQGSLEHTGFRGPAAGAESAALLRELEAHITTALDAPEPRAALESFAVQQIWRNQRSRTLIELAREADGAVTWVEREAFGFDAPPRPEPVSSGRVEARGDWLRVAGTLWHYDGQAGVALDPLDLSHRLSPAAHGQYPVVAGVARAAPEELLSGLTSTDARVRRECTWYLAAQIRAAPHIPEDYRAPVDVASGAQIVPLLADPDVLVRATACWAAGAIALEGARDALRANADHPFGAVRREAQRALAALDAPRDR